MSTMDTLTARPDHVPEAALYDLDLYLDPELIRDPHKRLAEILVDAPPVFWTPHNGGHWVITSYKLNHEASRDTAIFSSELFAPAEMEMMRAHLPAHIKHFPLPTPINLDPPMHTVFRAPLLKFFSPRAMMARQGEVRDLANALIDRVLDQGHCEFIADIAEPLPVQVFLKMMGLPLERLAEFRALVHEFMSPPTGPFDAVLRMRKIADAMRDEFEARRKEPRDDLISHLWATEIDGKPMTFELMEDFGVLLFIAGLDTVINAMGYGIRHLAQHPQFQDKLRKSPELIPKATEELLRRYSFVIPARRVAKDTRFGDADMREGDAVRLLMPAADLDPGQFEGPDSLNIERDLNVHFAFGFGPHRCLGAHLARIELQMIYEQMLTRLPVFRQDAERPVIFHCGAIIAMDTLALRWD